MVGFPSRVHPCPPEISPPSPPLPLEPAELQEWLEWAGARLIALPGPRVGPTPYRVIWPEYAQDIWEVTHFRAALRPIAAAPAPEEIPIMEEILALPAALADIWKRRVLHARALIHPITSRHLHDWARIGRTLGISPYKVKSLHRRALADLCVLAPSTKIQRIDAFFLTQRGHLPPAQLAP